jgi:hypothetical protein
MAAVACWAALLSATDCTSKPTATKSTTPSQIPPRSETIRHVGPAPPSAPRMPQSVSTVKIVPVDTSFAVELRTELNSTADRPGDPIRARVVTPLATVAGETVVSQDAELVGSIVGIRRDPGEAILVRFDKIETRWGASTIAAAFTRAQPETSVIGGPARSQGYDAELERAGGINISGEPDSTENDVPIVLPPGARLQLILTDDLAVQASESPESPRSVPSP